MHPGGCTWLDLNQRAAVGSTVGNIPSRMRKFRITLGATLGGFDERHPVFRQYLSQGHDGGACGEIRRLEASSPNAKDHTRLGGRAPMPADPVLSRELKSLQEEVSASQQQRLSAPLAAPANHNGSSAAAGVTAPPPAFAEAADEEQDWREQLGEFADEITSFFAQAEKNISTHPLESVAGAMLIGFLIGRLLGRR
jgi:hypothetical protein